MKRRHSLSGTILVTGALLCLACNEVPTVSAPGTDAVAPTTVTSKKPPNPGGNETPLIATFDDDQGGLVSDRAGAYVHGVEKVRAVLRTKGNLNFDAAQLKKNQSPDRFLCITVVENILGEVGEVLYPGAGQPPCVDATLNTNAIFEGDSDNDPDVVLGDMNVGEEGSMTAASRWTIGDTQYILRFGRRCNNTPTSGSDLDHFIPANRAVATRESETKWTLKGGDAYFCEIKLKLKGKGSGESSIMPVRGNGEASASFEVTLTLKE